MESINTTNNNKLNNIVNQTDDKKTNENSTKVTNTESPQTTIENTESPNQLSNTSQQEINNPPQVNQNKKEINNPPQVNQNKKVINNSPQKNNLYFETPQTPVATTVGGSEGFFSNIRSGINQILGGD